ncbi:hypothetical protein AB1Y20_018596 [Prymnesium parvum]|uniref:SAM domain-containing protein n=1 Tax=Prymnesium parvum TaxID=97485 RepID=A0AB34JRK8_PRYPA
MELHQFQPPPVSVPVTPSPRQQATRAWTELRTPESPAWYRRRLNYGHIDQKLVGAEPFYDDSAHIDRFARYPAGAQHGEGSYYKDTARYDDGGHSWESARYGSSYETEQLPSGAVTPPTPGNVHLWDNATVVSWLRSAELPQCVPAVRLARVDGAALLRLTPALIAEHLAMGTDAQLALCAALQPLKDAWRRWHMPQPHRAPSPRQRRPAAPSSRADLLGPREGELVVALSLVSMPEGVGGVYATLRFGGKAIETEAMARPASRGGMPLAYSIPVHSSQLGAHVAITCHAWLPQSGERQVAGATVPLVSVIEMGCLHATGLGPLHTELHWQPKATSDARHAPLGIRTSPTQGTLLIGSPYSSPFSPVHAESRWLHGSSAAGSSPVDRQAPPQTLSTDEEWAQSYASLYQQYQEEMNALLYSLLPRR